MKVTAYSYIRFSHPNQAKGDSLRRQKESAEAYCTRRGWTLSEASYRDLGVSAFKGKNALVGNLGEFLKAVEAGAIRAGSALIVESLDRISRQGIDAGFDLTKRILKAGIRIVTLTPEREFDVSATKSLSKGALEIQLILERAAEESETKSKRIADAWARKQVRAREARQIVTRMLPLWIEERDGKLELIPERAAAVRLMFSLSASGYGYGLIVNRLKAEGVPSFGGRDGQEWLRQYIGKVVTDRRAMGEYQPRKGRKADGSAVPNYFPAVVSEDEWLAAQAGVASRRRKAGRVGDHVNLFSGLLFNGRDRDTYVTATRQSHQKGREGEHQRVLVTTGYSHGRGSALSFPLATFERAVLSGLAEVDPREVLPKGEGPNIIDVLEGELEVLRKKKAELEAELLKGDVATIAKVLRQLEDRERELDADLNDARVKAAVPLSRSWEEAKSLVEQLDAADDPRDYRLRLRSVLRRIVSEVWMVVVPKGRDRLASVQVFFQGSAASRSYLIIHRCSRSGQRTGGRQGETVLRPGAWCVLTVKQTDTEMSPVLDEATGEYYATSDLRKSEDAAATLAYLESWPAEKIDQWLSTLGEPLS